MKQRKTIKSAPPGQASPALQEATVAYEATAASMVRTQIYLNQREHEFVKSEAARRDQPMAAVIRGFIDEKMEIPDDAWTNNPILEPSAHDPNWKGHEDGAINHDHYVYGCPKKWIKVKGKFVAAPPLPEDYYSNRTSADAYDQEIKQMDETR